MSQSRGTPGPSPLPSTSARELPLLSRAVLFLTPLRHRIPVLAATVLVFMLLNLTAVLDGTLGVVAAIVRGALYLLFVWFVMVMRNRLARPLPLPRQLMLRRARARYLSEESWGTLLPPDQVWEAVEQAFQVRGAAATRMGDSILVELDAAYGQADGGENSLQDRWPHAAALEHLNFKPVVLVFATPMGPGSRVQVFTRDGVRTAMYDVLTLADEMSASAVETVRKATEALDPPRPGKATG